MTHTRRILFASAITAMAALALFAIAANTGAFRDSDASPSPPVGVSVDGTAFVVDESDTGEVIDGQAGVEDESDTEWADDDDTWFDDDDDDDEHEDRDRNHDSDHHDRDGEEHGGHDDDDD